MLPPQMGIAPRETSPRLTRGTVFFRLASSSVESSVSTMSKPLRCDERLDSLLSAYEILGHEERNALLALAWRIVKGQMRYGAVAPKLKPGGRNWDLDLAEEVLDMCVYMQFIRRAETFAIIAGEEDHGA